jgi:hypothetical protein
VQLVLRAVGALGDAHLRNGHLRHIHEGLDAVVTRHRGGVDRGRQVIGRNRHAEIDTRAIFDRAVHRGEVWCALGSKDSHNREHDGAVYLLASTAPAAMLAGVIIMAVTEPPSHGDG